jgi:Uma2 family endonuclease
MERASEPDAPRGALTLADWAALPEDEPGEWVDGFLVEEEVTDFVHDSLVIWFGTLFRNWLGGRGFVAGSAVKIALSPHRGRKPDLVVFLPGGRVPPARGLVRIPPDIALEVVSVGPRDGRRDRVEKLNEYAAFGIRFYWLIDPDQRSLQIFELSSDGRYIHAIGATDGVVNAVPGCPGLVVDLDALWADIARLGPPSSEA